MDAKVKEYVLVLLKGYRDSMSEFTEEQMDYLIALVNFDIHTKQLMTDVDIETWKDK